jgi:hypothetical protein
MQSEQLMGNPGMFTILLLRIYFTTALHLGNILELDLPSDLHIIAVEIIEDRELSERLSPALQKMYPEILEKVTFLIRQITC